jgi:hypothetical protein
MKRKYLAVFWINSEYFTITSSPNPFPSPNVGRGEGARGWGEGYNKDLARESISTFMRT